jgi:drug/metabolite transporter (DMT)-like permease
MIKGIALVGLGAASYGVLATVVKLAYIEGYSTEEVTFSQFGIGWLILGIIVLLNRKTTKRTAIQKITVKSSVIKLILAGTSMGFTGIFYYRAVHFIPVSLCIVLLMQSVWMGVVMEALLERKFPSTKKIIAVITVLMGTVLATKVYSDLRTLDLEGLMWGILGALSYTVSLYTSNRIGLSLHNTLRSFWMMTGGFLVVIVAAIPAFTDSFSFSVFFPWGLFLATFGTILPPLLMNKGMPITGMGLGSIIISIEIPISVSMAYIFLGERIDWVQWSGVGLIIWAIVLLNSRLKL